MQSSQDDRALSANCDVTRRTFMQATAGGLGVAALSTLPGISAQPAVAAAQQRLLARLAQKQPALGHAGKRLDLFGDAGGQDLFCVCEAGALVLPLLLEMVDTNSKENTAVKQ